MALSGVHVECSFVGVTGKRGLTMPTYGKVEWSQTMATAGTTTNAAPTGSQEYGDPVFSVYPSVDCYVAIGPTPNASASPRLFCQANDFRVIACNPGDKLAWIAA